MVHPDRSLMGLQSRSACNGRFAGMYGIVFAAWSAFQVGCATSQGVGDKVQPHVASHMHQALPQVLPQDEITAATAPKEIPLNKRRIRIAAVGDIQMGRAWPKKHAALPPKDGAVLFAEVAQELGDADITFGNLETVLADSGESSKCSPTSKHCYAFRAPSAFAHTLAATGFDWMSVANNHSGDFGEEGRQATLLALDDAGIAHSGPVGDVASLDVEGVRVGMVAFATGPGLYRVQDIPAAQEVVAQLAKDHDIVWVSFHAGAEGRAAQHVTGDVEMFYGEDRGNVRAFAQGMVDVGADIVVGHGPHVLRGVEKYRNRLIAYSLGNFTAWYGFNLRGPLGVSAILHATLDGEGKLMDARFVPVAIARPGVPAPDPDAKAIALINRLSQEDFGIAPLAADGQILPSKGMP